MSSVTLTASQRTNLLSLQDTSALQATTQGRLSSGKKVSSALDNPVSFFTAQGLDNRAGDLSTLLDGISNGIQTIQAASTGITNITKLVEQAKGLANQALSTQLSTSGTASTAYTVPTAATTVDGFINGKAATQVSLAVGDSIDTAITKLNTSFGSGVFSKDSTGTKLVINANADIEFKAAADLTALGLAAGTGTPPSYGGTATAATSADLTVSGVKERKALASQYNALLGQISQLSNDSSYNGVNLINNGAASNKLHVQFNEKDTSNLDVAGQDLTSSGLKLTAITSTAITGTQIVGAGDWLLDGDVKSTQALLSTASSTLRSAASTFGSNLSVVQNRQDFSKNLINVLQTGSGNLTNADLNEEAANSQALSTRQSLGISALSLSNQAQQSILQLLR